MPFHTKTSLSECIQCLKPSSFITQQLLYYVKSSIYVDMQLLRFKSYLWRSNILEYCFNGMLFYIVDTSFGIAIGLYPSDEPYQQLKSYSNDLPESSSYLHTALSSNLLHPELAPVNNSRFYGGN